MIMKRTYQLLSIVVLITTLFSCTKKDSQLEYYQTNCKNLKIDDPSYEFLPDTFCGETTNSGSIKINFTIKNGQECFDKIVLGESKFYTSNAQFGDFSDTRLRLSDDPLVTISGNTVTFVYCYTVANTSDYNDLSNIVLKWSIENEIGDWSNSLELRIDFPGKSVSTALYDVKATVNVYHENIIIKLWDHASEDGDIVTVHLNGVKIINYHRLRKDGDYFTAKVNKGDNYLVIFAENQGSSGPNTCSISINDGKEIKLEPNLKTGEAIDIKW